MQITDDNRSARPGLPSAKGNCARTVPARNVLAFLGLLAAILPAGCKSGFDVADIKGIYGPAGRAARHQLNVAEQGRLGPVEGQAEFDAAKKLYDEEKYAEAEKAFKKVAKAYKDKAIEEDAMFMLAESQFAAGRYPKAQDSYEELMKKYTATRYVDKSTRRLWAIANHWLQMPKPASEVELVKFTEEDVEAALAADPDASLPFQFPLAPNFTDDSRPMFDTRGRALEALRAIWLNDPTGPLAADALMMTATYYLRRGDYREADRFMSIIREEYPQSKHASPAYVLGSRAKLMSYQGAAYDGKQLEDARRLTESTVRLFPELPQRPKLVEELGRMRSQTAERDWEKAQLYMRKKQPEAAAIYCQMIIESYPTSDYARQAAELLDTIAPQTNPGFPARNELQATPGFDGDTDGAVQNAGGFAAGE